MLGCLGGQQSLSGTVLPNAPAWKFALSAQHEERIGHDLGLAFTANWMWQSGVMYSLLQDPQSRQSAYGLLGLGSELHNGRKRLRLYCSNVLDSSYALNRGRDGNWNLNPYGLMPGSVTDAVKWTPGRNSTRSLRTEFAVNF